MQKLSKKSENRIEESKQRADQTLQEIEQAIIAQANEKAKKQVLNNEVKIDFDTMDYPEGSDFEKYIFAIPLMPETLERLKAKCLLQNEDVVEYLSTLIADNVEETFSLNPNQFNDAVYRSAEEMLISILDEHLEPLTKPKDTTTLPTINSKTKIENLTINLNIGGESPKNDEPSDFESLIGMVGRAALWFGSAKDKKENQENLTVPPPPAPCED